MSIAILVCLIGGYVWLALFGFYAVFSTSAATRRQHLAFVGLLLVLGGVNIAVAVYQLQVNPEFHMRPGHLRIETGGSFWSATVQQWSE